MKFHSLINWLLTLLLVCSCTGNKPSANEENGLPIYEFTSYDSVEISNLANTYTVFFNAADYNSAADMLYVVHNDSIFPLSEEQRMGFTTAMSTLPKYGCEIKDLQLYSDRDNQIRIVIKMSEDADAETEKGTINFFLNPVQVNGKWYLTLLDRYAEGVGLYH